MIYVSEKTHPRKSSSCVHKLSKMRWHRIAFLNFIHRQKNYIYAWVPRRACIIQADYIRVRDILDVKNVIIYLQVMWLASPRSEAQAFVCLPLRGAPRWVLLQYSIMVRIFFIVVCGIARFLCTMRVFEAQASSSSTRLPLCQISFLSRPPLLS